MPMISGTVSVAANAVSANVLAGSPFEFLSLPSLVELAATQAGAAPTDITTVWQIGGESLIQSGDVSDRSAFPTFRDDVMLVAGGQAGERLFLTFANTTAGALLVAFLVKITPI